MLKNLSILILLLVFTGCEDIYTRGTSGNTGSTAGTTNSSSVLAGIFVDSPVEGLSYTTYTAQGVLSLSGTTDTQGVFYYKDGETIQFKLGNVKIGNQITASNLITPLSVSGGGTDINLDQPATNIARFLQSIDEDANTTNGIKINDDAKNVASGVDRTVSFNVIYTKFATSGDSSFSDAKLIIDANSSTTLSPEVAQQHFSDSTNLNLPSPSGVYYALSNLGSTYTVYNFSTPAVVIREQANFDANQSDVSTSWSLSNGKIIISHGSKGDETLSPLALINTNTYIVSNDFNAKGLTVLQKGVQTLTTADISSNTFYLLNPNGNYAIYDFASNKATFAEEENVTMAWNIVGGNLEINTTLTNGTKFDDTITALCNRDTGYIAFHTFDLNTSAQYTNRIVSFGKNGQKFFNSQVPGTYFSVTDEGYYTKIILASDGTGTIQYYLDSTNSYAAATKSLTWSINSLNKLVISTHYFTGINATLTEDLKAISNDVALTQTTGNLRGKYTLLYRKPTNITDALLAGTYTVKTSDYNITARTHKDTVKSDFAKIIFTDGVTNTGKQLDSNGDIVLEFTWKISSNGDVLIYQKDKDSLYSTMTIMRNFNNELRVHEQAVVSTGIEQQSLYTFTK